MSDLKECWGLNSWNKFRALLQDSGPKHSIDVNYTPSWLQASFVTVVALKLSVFLLAVLGLYCCLGFSLVAVSRGCYLVAVHELLNPVTSFVAEHWL